MFNNKEKERAGTDGPKVVENKNDRSRPAGTSQTDAELSTMKMNVISERSEIIGTLKSQRDIRVAGKVDGGVEAEGKVIIASTGFVDGSINAEEAEIAGHVEGDVHVSGKLILSQSAVVESDLYAQSLAIEEGATFNGACHMEKESSSNVFDGSEEMDWSSDNNDNDYSDELSDDESDEDETAVI
jgi:cytoskeletal protein CcmA (bactofilin family)